MEGDVMTSISYLREVTDNVPEGKRKKFSEVYDDLSQIRSMHIMKYLWALLVPAFFALVYAAMASADVGVIGIPLHHTFSVCTVIILTYPIAVFYLHFFYVKDECGAVAGSLQKQRADPVVREALKFWKEKDPKVFNCANRYALLAF
ncbi:MAG: hypothetical protein MRY49_00310 [Candidatus Pacebacteria bacterium]|nr:hypothetical protein [Candidatus Paceibacterota bacterium]